MKKKRYNADSIKGIILMFTVAILFISIFGGLIATEIYVWTTYSNTPISEIPMWALIFMFRRK